MKITILAVGTRGDVQPYIALGLGLRAAGNDVRIAAASNFEQFIRGYGLEYARLDSNFREIMEADIMQQFMTRRNPLQAYRKMSLMLHHILECFAADSWKACQNSDAIIFSSIAVTGYSIAEKLGVLSCWAPLQPASRTSSFPSVISSIGNHRNGMLNWLTHIIEEQTTWQPSLKNWRQSLPRKKNKRALRTFIGRCRSLSRKVLPYSICRPTILSGLGLSLMERSNMLTGQ